MLYPLTFHPILKQRVWGGHKLRDLYSKHVPQGAPIGESWEISDRPEDVSVVAEGPLKGRDLHSLILEHGSALVGNAKLQNGRFPLLIKILDARETLSLQVHPPAHLAAAFGGEAKTEMWYITDAEPGAELFVGLKRGTSRGEFETLLRAGRVDSCFHRVPVRPGDTMFLPSGRVHALGAGLVLFEIQQNSDTTFRVHDWNRLGLDGKPRPLHVKESLASIDFDDFEPALAAPTIQRHGSVTSRLLVDDPLFRTEELVLTSGANTSLAPGQMHIIGLVEGALKIVCNSPPHSQLLAPGQFCLVPASISGQLSSDSTAKLLHITV